MGIMRSEPDAGQRNVADGSGLNPAGILDSRAMVVYDNSGHQLGMLFTPEMAIAEPCLTSPTATCAWPPPRCATLGG